MKNYQKSIIDIIHRFLSKNVNNETAFAFRRHYGASLDKEDGYLGILFLMENFRHFNLFDYLQYTNNNENYINNNYYKPVYIYERNSIFLRIMITALKYSHSIFDDLSFLRPHVEYFRCLLETDICSNIDYDVEFFLIAYLNFSEQAKSLAIKYNENFKAFTAFSPLNITVDFLVQKTLRKKSYLELSIDEIIIYRKMFNSLIKRKLYVGIDYFLGIKMFCCLLSEGRIWSTIIKTFTSEEVLALWLKYEVSLGDIKRTPLKKTIEIEYANKMNELVCLIKKEENEMAKNSINPKNLEERELMKKSYKYSILKMEMELELEMGFVVSLSDLVRIMIVSDHKNTAFFFLKTLQHDVFTVEMQKEIFEYLIEQDEETSLYFLMTIASNEIIEEKYMKWSLMNQFFQLALELSKFDKCKVVLNSSPPNSEYYYSYFHKFNYQHKIDTYKRLTLKTMSSNSDIDISSKKLNKFKTTYLLSNFEIQNKLAHPAIPTDNNKNSNNEKVNEAMHNPNETNASLLNVSRAPSIPLSNIHLKLNSKDKRKTASLQKCKYTFFSKRKPHFLKFYKDKVRESNKQISNSKDNQAIKPIKPINFDINVQMILIDQLHFGEHAFFCLCLLCSINEGNLILEYTDKICKSLLLLTKEKEEIIKCRSPILLCVLSAEFILKIGRLNKKMHFKCQTVAENLIRLAESFQSEVKDENMLKYFLAEQVDNRMRNALEIISENRFVSLLNTNIELIIKKQTFTKGESTYTFFRISRLLFSYGKDQTFNQVLSLNYFPPNVLYNFQFNQFIIDFDLKTMMLIFNSILCSTTFISYLSFVFNSLKKSSLYYSIPLYIYAFMLFAHYILRFIYIKKTGKKLFLSSIEYFNEIGIILGIALTESHFYCRLDDSNDLVDYLFYLGFLLIVVCHLSEIMVYLQYTSIGNIIRVISDMLNQLYSFLCIYLSFTLFCAQIFVTYFRYSNEDFSSFYSAVKTLFHASFGIYDFDSFNEMNLFGEFCLIAYISASNLCLMNLFVAVINNLFQKHTDNNLAEERAVAISVSKKLKWDKMYGSLILLPIPFSFLAFILSFSFLCTKSKRIEAVNLKIAKVLYWQIALSIFIFYFTLSIVLWPFAIIKSYLMKFVDTFIITEEFTFRNNSIQYICNVIFLPFILLKYIFEDSYLYWSLVYKENTLNNNTGEKIPITKETITALRDILLQIKWNDHKKVATVNDVNEKYFLNQKKEALSQFGRNLKIGVLSQTSQPTFHDKLFSNQKVPNELRYLIDKITDEDQKINIDLALGLIVQRESYNNRFLEYLYYFNLKQLKRGLQKFAFANEAYSSTYSFKKLQNLIYKLMIKFKMLYTLFPNEMINTVKPKLEYFNSNSDYSKKVLLKEKKGNNYSDYEDDDDEEEEKEELKIIKPILSALSPLI